MSNERQLRACVARHRRGVLARERAFLLRMDVLHAKENVGPVGARVADRR